MTTHRPQQRTGPHSAEGLLREIATYLRNAREELSQEWARRIQQANLLTAMSRDEILAETTTVYDQYVEAMETGNQEALQSYAQNLSERIIPRGVETPEVVGIVLLLRDVLARAVVARYHDDFAQLSRVLDAY